LAYNYKMYKSIILSSCLFGSFSSSLFCSVYLCAKSLELINRSLLENKKIPNKLFIINGLTFVISGSIYVYSLTLLKKLSEHLLH
jgi:hypothetical protein